MFLVFYVALFGDYKIFNIIDFSSAKENRRVALSLSSAPIISLDSPKDVFGMRLFMFLYCCV